MAAMLKNNFSALQTPCFPAVIGRPVGHVGGPPPWCGKRPKCHPDTLPQRAYLRECCSLTPVKCPVCWLAQVNVEGCNALLNAHKVVGASSIQFGENFGWGTWRMSWCCRRDSGFASLCTPVGYGKNVQFCSWKPLYHVITMTSCNHNVE